MKRLSIFFLSLGLIALISSSAFSAEEILNGKITSLGTKIRHLKETQTKIIAKQAKIKEALADAKIWIHHRP